MINLRYRIIHEIGAGGSGKVFLVEDILAGNIHRAVKVFTNFPSTAASGVDPFVTETSILLTLQHPHLVALHDFDIVRQSADPSLRGFHFLTMEYVQGVDAFRWISRLPPVHPRKEAIRKLLGQCLAALAYVHARGVIHSDIKPQNLLVQGEPGQENEAELKLTDFGFGRSSVGTSDVPARGTLEYSAPEILRGESYDHRIDLYSLGATFYHLVEGHCPFEASDSLAVVKKILAEELPFRGEVWQGMPDVSSLVQSLLMKDPVKRPASAEDALKLLGTDAVTPQELDGIRRAGVPFVGRTEEFRHIVDLLCPNEAATPPDHAPVVLLTGPEGMGKTRLAEEVVRAVRIAGRRVFRTDPGSGGMPYSSLRPTIRAMVIEGRSFADFAEASLPEGFAFVERFLEQPAPTGDREATVEALARFVIECASLVPLVIVAEDVETIDENSVQVLQTIARDLPPGQTVILATSAGGNLLSGDTRRAETIPLADLTQPDVAALAHALLGQEEAVGLLGGRLHEVLGGMPMLILDALHALQDSIDAQYLGQNIEAAIALVDRIIPRDADKLLLHRFARLAPADRLVFSFASCFENPAPLALAERSLALHPTRIRSALRNLVAAGLAAADARESHIAVRMVRLKRIVYESLGEDRMNIHRAVMEALSPRSADLSLPDLQELAYHCLQFGETSRASSYYEQAATRALGLQAYQRALDLFSRSAEAAGMAGEPDRVLTLQVWKAEALLQSGSIKEAVELATPMVSIPSLSETLRSWLKRLICTGRSRLGDFEQARAGFRELVERATDARERAELMEELVSIEINLGGFKRAEETCLDQLHVAEELKDEPLKGAILTDLGIATFLQGRYDDAATRFRQALGIYERLDDENHVVSSITNVGNALNARGDSAAAIEQWRVALEHATASGTVSQQAKIQNNLGIAYFNLRRYTDARASYRQAREMFQRLGMKGELTYTLTNLGEVMLADGDYGGALSSWSDALALYEVMTDARGLAETYLQLAEIRILLGDYHLPAEFLQEAHRLIEAEGIEPFRGSWLYWSGILNAKKGAISSALPQIREAQSRFTDAGEHLHALRCRTSLADCLRRCSEPKAAVEQAQSVLSSLETEASPVLRAEARYLLGILERDHPGSTSERPLIHFREGMQLLEHEPICEATWMLSYALAREYFDRGQRERARQNLLMTERILRHFASTLPTEELRTLYLAADGRAQALANIDRHFHHQDHEQTQRT